MIIMRVGIGGAMRDRTADLLRAKQALSQLSYSPIYHFHQSIYCHNFALIEAKESEAYISMWAFFQRRAGQNLVGLGRFELPTSPLSGVRSNQLSYRPNRLCCT